MKLTIPFAAGLLVASTASYASLELVGPQDFGGTGLGTVNTILTIQSPGSSSFESGSVTVGAVNTQVISGDAKTGASQTKLLTFGDLGIASASNLRVVLNANEPGNAAGNGLVLNDLVLTIYDPTGAAVFTSGAFSATTFPTTFEGTGNAGFVFRLDTAQATAAQAALGSSFGDFRIGLSASASDATGGTETFFIYNQTAPVPEPGTYALMLAGLASLGWVGRLKRRRDDA